MKEADLAQRAAELDGADCDDSVDRRNTTRLKEIILKIGWPTIPKVGLNAAHDAWLIAQHADHDVAFQKQCLELMKRESAGDVDRSDIAYLEDRYLVNSGLPQLYGTQFRQSTRDGGTLHFKPIEDPEKVDLRRHDMNLNTFAEYKKEMEAEDDESWRPNLTKRSGQ